MTSAPPGTRRRILAAVSILAAVGALAFIASRVDWRETAGVVRRAGWAATGRSWLCTGTIFLRPSDGMCCYARGWKIPLSTTAASMLWATPRLCHALDLGGEPLRISIGSRSSSETKSPPP